MTPVVTMFPTPRIGFYEWGEGEHRRRQEYVVLGIAVCEPESDQSSDIYRATRLLVERDDHRLTWLRLDHLTLEPAALTEKVP